MKTHARHWARCLALCAALALTSLPGLAEAHVLNGTFRLVSATRTIVETGEVEDSFGPDPVGHIMYGADGRMMVLIVRSDRPTRTFRDISDADRIQLFETMAAYSGTYSFDGNIVRHDIDASWNGILTGATQIRRVRMEGDLLIYTTDPGPSPTDGRMITSTLVWRRVGDAGTPAK